MANNGSETQHLQRLVAQAKRGVVVAGRHERSTPLGEAAAAFCEAAGWPLLADPLSGARRGTAAIAHYDALLRDDAFAAGAVPDLVIRVGDLPVSKPLRTWLAGLGEIPQVALDPEGAWQDPASILAESLALEPAGALAELAAPQPGRGYGLAGAAGAAADEQAAEAILGALGPREGLSEPAIAAELGTLLPARRQRCSSPPRCRSARSRPSGPPATIPRACSATVARTESTGSSRARSAPPRAADGPVVLLIGDVALAHDIGGLLAAARLELKLTIVLIDNGGGGIFDFLPISHDADGGGARHLRPPHRHPDGLRLRAGRRRCTA